MIKHIPLAMLLLVSALPVTAADLKPMEGNVAAPPLHQTDLQGEAHELKDYQGSVVLVQFWATYCAPCRKEMPSMNNLMQKMGDTPFVILAINMAEPEEAVREFVDEVKPVFPILLDRDGESIGTWKVFAAPSNFVISPDGLIRYTLFGGVEWDSDELVAKLKALANDP